jgi:glutathione S-transferase
LRAQGPQDLAGVADARSPLGTACEMIDRSMKSRIWSAGDRFSMADCAAAPALFFSDIAAPFPGNLDALASYFERLVTRPSVGRVIDQARPHFKWFAYADAMLARFRQGELRPISRQASLH